MEFEGEHGDERFDAKTVLWAGGVTASEFGRKLALRTGAETDKTGRFRVNPDLTVPKYPDVYVVGNLALAFRPDGRQLPGVAQVAMQEGAHAAKGIVQRVRGSQQLSPFQYFDKGERRVLLNVGKDLPVK